MDVEKMVQGWRDSYNAPEDKIRMGVRQRIELTHTHLGRKLKWRERREYKEKLKALEQWMEDNNGAQD